MGAITPTLSSGLGLASSLASTVNTINSIAGTFSSDSSSLRVEQNLALEQLQAKQALQAQQLAAENALAKEKLAADAAADDADRRRSLKNAVARQRAQYGASGISSGDGSAQAVLLGLFEESEEEKAEREKLDSLRTQALDQDLANQNSLNVLQLTQLQEKQRLQRKLQDNDKFLF